MVNLILSVQRYFVSSGTKIDNLYYLELLRKLKITTDEI